LIECYVDVGSTLRFYLGVLLPSLHWFPMLGFYSWV